MATLTLPDSLVERLEQMAREQGLSVLELLREFAGQSTMGVPPSQAERRAARKSKKQEDSE